MENIFHKVRELYAWNISRSVFLLEEDDLLELIEKYLEDQETVLRLNLKACIFKSTMIGGDEKDYHRLEKLLSERLRKACQAGELTMLQRFGMIDTLTYLEDYLEVYRFLTRRIDFEVESLTDSSLKLFRIIPVKTQSLFQRATNRLGDRLQAYNVPVLEIVGLVGIPSLFKLYTTNGVFEFSDATFDYRSRSDKDLSDLKAIKEENARYAERHGNM